MMGCVCVKEREIEREAYEQAVKSSRNGGEVVIVYRATKKCFFQTDGQVAELTGTGVRKCFTERQNGGACVECETNRQHVSV